MLFGLSCLWVSACKGGLAQDEEELLCTKTRAEIAFIFSTFSSVRPQRHNSPVWPKGKSRLHPHFTPKIKNESHAIHAASEEVLLSASSGAPSKWGSKIFLSIWFLWRERKERGSIMTLTEQSCWETTSVKDQYGSISPRSPGQSNPMVVRWQRTEWPTMKWLIRLCPAAWNTIRVGSSWTVVPAGQRTSVSMTKVGKLSPRERKIEKCTEFS